MPRSSREKAAPARGRTGGKSARARESAERKQKVPSGPAEKLSFHKGPCPEAGRTILALELPSDLSLKFAYILRVLEALTTELSLPEVERQKCELCLDEAFKNAIVWGNGQDPTKKIRIRAFAEDGRWGFTVSDQGSGFSGDALPDYSSEEFAWLDRGRGIFVLLNYLSEVSYYEGGRTLLAKS